MNKNRRTQISNIVKETEALKDKLQKVLDEEQETFDNMPENLQYSMRGEESQEYIEYMENAIDSFNNIVDELENIV